MPEAVRAVVIGQQTAVRQQPGRYAVGFGLLRQGEGQRRTITEDRRKRQQAVLRANLLICLFVYFLSVRVFLAQIKKYREQFRFRLLFYTITIAV